MRPSGLFVRPGQGSVKGATPSDSPTSVGAHSVPVGDTLADAELLPDAIEGLIVREDGKRYQGSVARGEGEDLATDYTDTHG
jgi:hypothetical protein